jgi:hypothetical protein
MDKLGLPSFVAQRPIVNILLLGLVVLIAAWKIQQNVKARKYKLPPRIPGVPVFGNTFQLPPLKQGVWGIEMARKYGEM